MTSKKARARYAVVAWPWCFDQQKTLTSRRNRNAHIGGKTMRNKLILAMLLGAATSYGMGYIRAAISNMPPPVVVTNAPPAPVPPPVVTNTTPTPPPATGPTLTACKWRGFPMVQVSYTGIDGWPTKAAANGKTLKGILKLNGKKVEWFKPGQTAISVVNALEVGGKYYQAIPKGATVTISIADINGKNESNRMTLVWP